MIPHTLNVSPSGVKYVGFSREICAFVELLKAPIPDTTFAMTCATKVITTIMDQAMEDFVGERPSNALQTRRECS